jgi:hypothetical protein
VKAREQWGNGHSNAGGRVEEAMRPEGLHFRGDPPPRPCKFGRDKEGPCRCCHTQPQKED